MVVRDDSHEEPFWKCDGCSAEFIPSFVIGGLVAAESTARADDIVAVASAMLWDFHERAVERYGKDVADAVTPEAQGPEYTPETCPQHAFAGGRCQHCGTSQFLGEGT